jgi:hypothetical protein
MGLLIQAAVLAKAQRRKGAAIHFSKTINPRLKTTANTSSNLNTQEQIAVKL